MKILHISAECFPAAKAGGMGDVVGALPKVQNRGSHSSTVMLPKYKTSWIEQQECETLFEGIAPFGTQRFAFSIQKVTSSDPGFELLLVDIPGRFDRPGVYSDPESGYAYWDEMARSMTFQIAVLEYLVHKNNCPDVIHCHDHHTALVPFMISHCFRYESLKHCPSVLTIHNGEYQGRYDIGNYMNLPAFSLSQIGLLDWDNQLNSLAAGIKCAWRVTTVSEGYLGELMVHCHGLERLLRMEREKCFGIINGIDLDVWNPASDPALVRQYTKRSVVSGKRANKEFLCETFNLDPGKPLFSFIGRLVKEKGADLLPGIIERVAEEGEDLNFLILGTGDPALHVKLNQLKGQHVGYYNSRLEYNEDLAHRIYAGSDFLLMPSRVEPCGLNQLYAMRYGTVPIVRSTGGLRDTVLDISVENGFGFLFENLSIEDALVAIRRALEFYGKKKSFSENRKQIMTLDYSWERASGGYETLYRNLI